MKGDAHEAVSRNDASTARPKRYRGLVHDERSWQMELVLRGLRTEALCWPAHQSYPAGRGGSHYGVRQPSRSPEIGVWTCGSGAITGLRMSRMKACTLRWPPLSTRASSA